MNSPHTAYTEDEQTTRDQIISAAIREFAEHGFRGASIRGIAKAAGVSAGLVQHHFGTKDGLKQACDDWVMIMMKDTQYRMLQRDAPPMNSEMMERLDTLQPIIDYLVMSLASGSETAAGWFQEITEYTHDALTSGRIGPPLNPETEDSWAIAAVQTAMALGVTAFYRNIQQTLGSPDESELMVRLGYARMFLASDRVLGEETRERLQQTLDQYARTKSTGKPPPADPEGHDF